MKRTEVSTSVTDPTEKPGSPQAPDGWGKTPAEGTVHKLQPRGSLHSNCPAVFSTVQDTSEDTKEVTDTEQQMCCAPDQTPSALWMPRDGEEHVAGMVGHDDG